MPQSIVDFYHRFRRTPHENHCNLNQFRCVIFFISIFVVLAVLYLIFGCSSAFVVVPIFQFILWKSPPPLLLLVVVRIYVSSVHVRQVGLVVIKIYRTYVPSLKWILFNDENSTPETSGFAHEFSHSCPPSIQHELGDAGIGVFFKFEGAIHVCTPVHTPSEPNQTQQYKWLLLLRIFAFACQCICC